ncbi:MAG: response regulator transcription factor [Anaerolineaceae bacterium]|nr:response regulator transcription factor [Anaerolineaceae bacterium]
MAEIRILVVGDNPLARVGLVALLAGAEGLEIAGQCGGAVLLDEFDLYGPDALVCDLGWEDSPSWLADLRDTGLATVALLNSETQVADAWAAGVTGLLRYNTDAEGIAAALTAVLAGLVVLDSGLAANVLPAGDTVDDVPIENLTPREKEVLQLLAEGLANKAIAQKLGITDHTVKFHVNAIMSKLGAQSRTEAVVRATRAGLIML